MNGRPRNPRPIRARKIMEDQETLVRLGEEAECCSIARLSAAPSTQLVDASFQTFSNTAPLRPRNAKPPTTHYRALVDIVSTLRQRVSVKDEIVSKEADDDTNQEGGD